jgi:hypothetical protein
MDFIYFRISGQELELDKITSIIGITPSSTQKKGEIRQYRGKEIISKENIWMIAVEVNNTENTNDILVEMTERLFSHEEYISKLTKSAECAVFVTLHHENYQRNFHMSKNTMSKLVKMGVDFYLTSMDVRELTG